MFSPEFIEDLWYGKHPVSILLAPAGWLYGLMMQVRRTLYQSGLIPVQKLRAPVIVIGNLTVGGTGKTPLVIWIARFLKARGFRPGIVSRGYGGKVKEWPQQVRTDSNPDLVGDEPVLIARRTGCPVAISPKRRIAAEELIAYAGCNIILCDDGLQHLALPRDIEIAVVDGIRRFGNHRCLPAGPLREPVSRISSVDMVVSNGATGRHEYMMEYIPENLVSLADENKRMNIDTLSGGTVHALAGIGNPSRFFAYLRGKKLQLIKHEFPDHYAYAAADIQFGDGLPVVMTEKDAVKCMRFASKEHWYLPINAKMPDTFEHRFEYLLKEITNGQETA
ncbi:MAG: tetraacyldisaccharide 4'-kinase [Gammaproteobacteria bacterium RBG_16_51_14]|nr:MAG: tetraacyldisaccharide 4'-kinase [Gammaproteobacteria bacterium RBG_16_51_14]